MWTHAGLHATVQRWAGGSGEGGGGGGGGGGSAGAVGAGGAGAEGLLSALGVPPGARVGVAVPNGPDLMAALMVVMARRAAVPVNPLAAASEVLPELAAVGCDALLYMGPTPPPPGGGGGEGKYTRTHTNGFDTSGDGGAGSKGKQRGKRRGKGGDASSSSSSAATFFGGISKSEEKRVTAMREMAASLGVIALELRTTAAARKRADCGGDVVVVVVGGGGGCEDDDDDDDGSPTFFEIERRGPSIRTTTITTRLNSSV